MSESKRDNEAPKSGARLDLPKDERYVDGSSICVDRESVILVETKARYDLGEKSGDSDG